MITITGLSAWPHTGPTGATIPIGPIDAVHTRADGHRSSTTSWLEPPGFVLTPDRCPECGGIPSHESAPIPRRQVASV